ncbi:unnamed protein product [Arabidopsis lyrata]|uniref:Predicted protein n=1 Tax=Arabidopsis lyrata subsp. lyrata TaxID=81972 RepID=D7LV58_ARALL|nr:predicted protein [Arabidopsis lyrata subsp. lyrata]CAH8268722.1 unnamed protein product [Arabidopsis lyrata]
MAKTNLLLAATLLLCFIVITSFARPDPNICSHGLEVKRKCDTEECMLKGSMFAHVDYSNPGDKPPKNWGRPPHAPQILNN